MPNMKVKEILIINQPMGNRGDESAHRALVRSLNRTLPDVHVTILAFMDDRNAIGEFEVKHPLNKYVRFVFPHNLLAEPFAKFLVRHDMTAIGTRIHPILRQLKSYYQKADLVLCAPGGICMGGFQNWRHLCLLQLALLWHRPLAYYSRSIGPFPMSTRANRKFKELSSTLLRSFDFLSLRDCKSKRLADEMNLKYVSAVDTAFLEKPVVEVPEELQKRLAKDYVVFVPNRLTWHYGYCNVSQYVVDDFYLQLMNHVAKVYENCQIVMFPQLCSLGNRGDYDYFRSLKTLSNQTNVYVVPDTYGSDIQQTIVSKAKMVIGARYHTIVFAINNEIPFLALSYEHKIQGLLEDLGMSEHGVDITEAFMDETQKSQTLRICNEKLNVLRSVRPDRSLAHQLATKCFNCFIQYVNNMS